jgi:hypothetical protein
MTVKTNYPDMLYNILLVNPNWDMLLKARVSTADWGNTISRTAFIKSTFEENTDW